MSRTTMERIKDGMDCAREGLSTIRNIHKKAPGIKEPIDLACYHFVEAQNALSVAENQMTDFKKKE